MIAIIKGLGGSLGKPCVVKTLKMSKDPTSVLDFHMIKRPVFPEIHPQLCRSNVYLEWKEKKKKRSSAKTTQTSVTK